MQVLLGSTTHLWSEVEMQQNEANVSQRVLSMTINCFSGTFPEVPGSTPSGASPF